MDQAKHAALLPLTTGIVSAFLEKNQVAADTIPALIGSVHRAIAACQTSDAGPAVAPAKPKPAVPVSRSIHPDYLICLEDGSKMKTLKRYLRSRYEMSPEEYRSKWGLQASYPMVAPSYSALRSQHALASGLGKVVGKAKPKLAAKAKVESQP